ncbi:uncharacterized protein LACBIDRAFT_333421 [Laccaria bicolor S238N-H82]|uniref:Predicted protein n=1 Tax=Laccaria bicolor (strain S238N-H82 / ATCC MYA-4686) TaxID=486041 RepID=B0DVV5_LACBS|nr:uncharacterized protein LACBIDRAFT_333421 [Laccaria bicolor S238N-H82]EDR01366.1 predicted protein [Laccaria bicolor S238N-H82]|eukprot:XP_001888073.1 predicted protein [Laccaria bicolor S238N-H82]
MSLLERVRAIRDAYYNECRDRRNLFDERGRRLDHPSDKGAGASYPRPRVRRGVWRRGVAGMSGNDDEDADESGDSEQEDSSGEESDTESDESGDSEDDEDEGDAEAPGISSKTFTLIRRLHQDPPPALVIPLIFPSHEIPPLIREWLGINRSLTSGGSHRKKPCVKQIGRRRTLSRVLSSFATLPSTLVISTRCCFSPITYVLEKLKLVAQSA